MGKIFEYGVQFAMLCGLTYAGLHLICSPPFEQKPEKPKTEITQEYGMWQEYWHKVGEEGNYVEMQIGNSSPNFKIHKDSMGLLERMLNDQDIDNASELRSELLEIAGNDYKIETLSE